MFFLSLILGTPRAHSHTHGERGLSARARHDTARVTGRLTARRPADHLHQSKRLEGGTWWREAMNGEVAAAPKAPPPFFKKPLPWDYGILRAAVRQGTFFLLYTDRAGSTRAPPVGVPPTFPLQVRERKREKRARCSMICAKMLTFPSINWRRISMWPLLTPFENNKCASFSPTPGSSHRRTGVSLSSPQFPQEFHFSFSFWV